MVVVGAVVGTAAADDDEELDLLELEQAAATTTPATVRRAMAGRRWDRRRVRADRDGTVVMIGTIATPVVTT
jgi:hypothetical protein